MMSFVRWFSFVLLAMLPLAMAAPARAQGFEQVIDAYLAGEDAARRDLLQGGLAAIEALEQRLISEDPLSDEEIAELVEQLNADDYKERERASLSLERAGDAVLPLLTRLRGAAESPEIRYRLDELLEKMQSGEYASALPDLLVVLYEDHMGRVALERLTRLEENPHDPTALLFVRLAPKREVLETIEASDDRLQILYQLARLYTLHDRAEIGSGLRDFDGYEVLELASSTYWPHELDPLTQRLGRWQATFASRVEGAEAHEVVSFTLETRIRRFGELPEQERGDWGSRRRRDQNFSEDGGAGPTGEETEDSDDDATAEPEEEETTEEAEEDEIEDAQADDRTPLRVGNCNSYILWIYLWRYEPPAEGEPVDNKGAGIVLGVQGANDVELNVVSHIDEDMPLPVVRVSDREKTFWMTGSALDWARPLIPPEYIELIRFRQRNYPEAEILSTPE